jgi:hypothetical protein
MTSGTQSHRSQTPAPKVNAETANATEQEATMTRVHDILTRPTVHRRSAVLAALLLAAVGVVHLIDGPGSLSDMFYIGALELALVAAVVPLAVLLCARPLPAFWHAAGALCTLALVLFVASRTVGLPGSTDDIGNWGQTLGLVNIGTELAVIAVAAYAVLRRGPRSLGSSQS